MSVWIVKQRPAGAVHPGHVAEARRASAAASARVAVVDDDALLDALWAARAAPVLVDALADARGGRRLNRVSFHRVRVVRRGGLRPTEPLLAIALCAVGAEEAEVRFVRKPEEGGAPVSEDTPIVVHFSLLDAPSAAVEGADVGIQRFRHGQSGRTRGGR